MTRKITHALAAIKAGKQQKLYLGNLDSKRDWGYTPEFIEVQWKILQQEKARRLCHRYRGIPYVFGNFWTNRLVMQIWIGINM